MRKGFTLVEILVSVTLISVVALTLLQVSGNNTKMLDFLHKKSRITLLPSMFISHATENDHNSKLYLYDTLRKTYPSINNDDVITMLKEYNPLYREEIISTIDLSENDEEIVDDEIVDDEYGYYDDEEQEENPLIITISKITLSLKNQSAYLYKMSLEGL